METPTCSNRNSLYSYHKWFSFLGKILELLELATFLCQSVCCWSYKYCQSNVKRRVWRYQRGNQNPYIEKEQTTQWPKGQKDKQRSTKHTHQTKDPVTRTPIKTGGELRCSGRVSTVLEIENTKGLTTIYKTYTSS
jgi:hypothetical protein